MTQISTCPRATKQGRVKCRYHAPFQRSQHREQSRRRAEKNSPMETTTTAKPRFLKYLLNWAIATSIPKWRIKSKLANYINFLALWKMSNSHQAKLTQHLVEKVLTIFEMAAMPFLCRDPFFTKISYHRNVSLAVYLPIFYFSFRQKNKFVFVYKSQAHKI